MAIGQKTSVCSQSPVVAGSLCESSFLSFSFFRLVLGSCPCSQALIERHCRWSVTADQNVAVKHQRADLFPFHHLRFEDQNREKTGKPRENSMVAQLCRERISFLRWNSVH